MERNCEELGVELGSNGHALGPYASQRLDGRNQRRLGLRLAGAHEAEQSTRTASGLIKILTNTNINTVTDAHGVTVRVGRERGAQTRQPLKQDTRTHVFSLAHTLKPDRSHVPSK